MTTILILATAAFAAVVAVVLAFGSLHLVVGFISTRVLGPVRRFVERQRERRRARRADGRDRRRDAATVATEPSTRVLSRSDP